MVAAASRPVLVNLSSTSLPKRDELSLRTVLAHPCDSMIGLVPITRRRSECGSSPAARDEPEAARAR